MIPLYKLEKLHRAQRLRKIASVFAAAERRLCSGAEGAGIGANECRYFSDVAKALSRDSLFGRGAVGVFSGAAGVFARAAVPWETRESAASVRRALNEARHVLLAETGRGQADWDFLDGDGRLDPSRRRAFPGTRVYLDDVRSPFNVGAMFRAAESFGVEKICVSPFSADPNHPRAQRTAMGCVDALPWERVLLFAPETEARETETPAPETRLPVFALETGGVPLAEFPFPRRGLLVVGSEELGVNPRALAAADASLGRVSIPCYGAKGSLNASVAFGIAAQAWAAKLAGG